jgi:hypothetical protein
MGIVKKYLTKLFLKRISKPKTTFPLEEVKMSKHLYQTSLIPSREETLPFPD